MLFLAQFWAMCSSEAIILSLRFQLEDVRTDLSASQPSREIPLGSSCQETSRRQAFGLPAKAAVPVKMIWLPSAVACVPGWEGRWGLVDELCDRPDTRILSPSLWPPQTHSPAWATDVLRLADQNQLAFRYHPSPFLTFTSSLTNYT